MKLKKLAVPICLWACLQSYTALACRYTVRDTGFVDLGAKPYRLYGYVNQDTPADIVSTFTEISHAALLDSNINIEIIDADKQKEHPAMKYLDLWPTKSFPAAVLVSPDGQSVIVPVTERNQLFKQTLRSALDVLVSSPTRDEILQHVSTAYGAILLIEGTDVEKNVVARKAASGAIEIVGDQMRMMPKSFGQPPVLIVIDRESISREKILLWSLGLDADKVGEPRAAVLYGKMRWVGPLMKGEEISEANLTGILSVIGADCECGLDISWTQGTMLPVRWDEKVRARVAEALDFDPEHPMVKMEVSSILRTEYSFPGAPFGYTELIADSAPLSETQETSVHTDRTDPNGIVSEPLPGKTVSDGPIHSKSSPTLQKSLYIIVGLAMAVIAAGFFILFRAARRNS